MRLLMWGCHASLEHDELQMFHELGLEVFDMGNYLNPSAPHVAMRPALPQIPRKIELECLRCDRFDTDPAMIEWADVLYFMGLPDQWLIPQLGKFKGKRVIWRTIGQSNQGLEDQMRPFRDSGQVQIVRYSPNERRFFEPQGHFAGQDALIRFAKKPDEFCGWIGDRVEVGNISQHDSTPHQRDNFIHWNFWERATFGLPRSFAGSHSELIGGLGELDYEEMKRYLHHLRCYCYLGTVPASVTLGGIEAMLTGVPMVSVSKDWNWAGPGLFEFDELVTAFADPNDARLELSRLLNDYEYARQVSEKQRQRAIELFGWDAIREQWRAFFNGLS